AVRQGERAAPCRVRTPSGAAAEGVILGSQNSRARIPGNPQAASATCHEPVATYSGTTSPAASAATRVCTAMYTPVTPATRAGNQRLATTGTRTLPSATPALINAVPSSSVRADPLADLSTAPPTITARPSTTVRSTPRRAEIPCTRGETTAKPSTGSAVSR